MNGVVFARLAELLAPSYSHRHTALYRVKFPFAPSQTASIIITMSTTYHLDFENYNDCDSVENEIKLSELRPPLCFGLWIARLLAVSAMTLSVLSVG